MTIGFIGMVIGLLSMCFNKILKDNHAEVIANQKRIIELLEQREP